VIRVIKVSVLELLGMEVEVWKILSS